MTTSLARAADGRVVAGVGANDCDAFPVAFAEASLAAILAPVAPPDGHLTMP
jgi:hypothetical protein